jgi:CubicO group peptidase (beta-lactamase class C family)
LIALLSIYHKNDRGKTQPGGQAEQSIADSRKISHGGHRSQMPIRSLLLEGKTMTSQRRSIVLALTGLAGAVFVFLLISGAFPRLMPLDEEVFAHIPGRIETYLQRTGVPSVAVAVAVDGNVVWETAVGLADKEEKIPATPHTMYQIGSISKNFTATAMLILRERGLVDLDEPANRYLGEAKLQGCWCDADEATVRRLLLHTAGLPNYWNSYYQHEIDRKTDMDEAIRRHGILVFPPGEKFYYSNLGYGVAGRIIERVSGKTYPEFMREELFEPLGLADTAVFASSVAPDEADAGKYGPEGEAWPVWSDDFASSGFVYSSVHDLVRYGMFHLKIHLPDQRPVISDGSIDLMKTAEDPKGMVSADYSLGWGTAYVRGCRLITHGGGGPGIDAHLVLVPSENAVIAVLANSREGRSWEVCLMVADKVLPVIGLDGIRDGIASLFSCSWFSSAGSPRSLAGEWRGDVRSFAGDIPIRLVISDDGSCRVQRTDGTMAAGEWVPARRRVRLAEGSVDIWFTSGILHLDPDRPEDYMRLILFEQNGRLRGSASAGCDNLGPGKSIFFLPSCVELVRVE